MNNDGPRFFRPAPFEHHGGPGVLPWVIFALQLLMLAGLALLLARAFAWRPRPAGPPRFARRAQGSPTDPLDVLRYRYARGELSRDEYLQATHDLGGEPDELPPS